MTAASTPAAVDGSNVGHSRPVNRRLQLWGGAAAIVGTVLGIAPNLLFAVGPQLVGPAAQVLTIVGGLLMVAAAVLLAKAFVGDRAPFDLGKLGGILLILFHCWWLAVVLPNEWWLVGPTAGEAWHVTRLLIGVLAGIAIATSWPARGFNRWSMLIVAACFGLGIYGAYALILSMGQAGAEGALLLNYLQPLSVLAFGAGHAISGWRAVRTTGADASV